jgi:hypothetical protein
LCGAEALDSIEWKGLINIFRDMTFLFR